MHKRRVNSKECGPSGKVLVWLMGHGCQNSPIWTCRRSLISTSWLWHFSVSSVNPDRSSGFWVEQTEQACGPVRPNPARLRISAPRCVSSLQQSNWCLITPKRRTESRQRKHAQHPGETPSLVSVECASFVFTEEAVIVLTAAALRNPRRTRSALLDHTQMLAQTSVPVCRSSSGAAKVQNPS